ncbi:MAG: hypothetical protein WAS07_11750, partial [Micropruina sp.]
SSGGTWWSLFTGLSCLLGVAVALQVLVGHLVGGPVTPPAVGRLDRLIGALLGPGGLVIILITTLPGLSAPDQGLADWLGPILWAGIGPCLYAFHRSGRGSLPRDQVIGWARIALGVPFVLIAVAVAVSLAHSNLSAALALLQYPLAGMGFAAIAVVPAILVRAGVGSLAVARKRGELVAQRLRQRPNHVRAFLAAKALLLVALLSLPGAQLLPPTWLSWLIALVVAGLVTLSLWFDGRQLPSRQDEAPLSSAAGWLVGGPLGLVAALVLPAALAPGIAQRPMPTVGLVLVGVASWGLVKWGSALPQGRLGWFVAAAVGGLSWLIFGRSRAGSGLLLNAPNFGEQGLIVVLLVGLGIVAAALIVLAVKGRRLRLLGYLAAVVLWIAILQVSDTLTKRGVGLEVDLALTVLLFAGLHGHSPGRFRRIDLAEATGMAVVVLLVLDIPLVLRAFPVASTVWVVAVGVASTIALAFWHELPALLIPGRVPTAFRALGSTCLVFSLTGALTWVAGPPSANLFQSISGVLLPYVSLPVAVLLASQTPARPARQQGTV